MSRIDEEAAAWLARRRRARSPDAIHPDDAAEARFRLWYEADPRHRGAYLRAEAAWLMLDSARGMALAQRKPGIDRRLLLSGAAAASLAGVVAVGISRSRLSFATERGELRNVPLGDKSLAAINTDSQIEVDMTESLRHVQLVKGEAWFQVAKNPDAPFVVSAGDVRVRAVGTAFGVRRHDHGADVLVTEGTVETWRVGEPGKRTRLTAGNEAFVPYAAATVDVAFHPGEVTRKLAWREREIILKEESLADAAAEFNRYNTTQIVISDPELASRKLVGGFRVDQPDSFARAVHAALDVPVSIADDRITIGVASGVS
ncbi:FecR domain-containing protein [Asticcacaulis sp. EMRT-3]|uniref:FecR family protein n=1 Tax=Asticcacaulis sp. EMRT-3 TaxID=3040349 RepID=UPI0024AF73FA|nr:FecR domain-containing protein [Asticcacaulis sp. EMRT-3]MDI7775862.1 FecR domain-containing protein [Asticcacaulis sp. EMRT-3]